MRWARWVALVVGAPVCAVVIGCGSRPFRSERVNAAAIRGVEVGMSQEEVRAILGPPLKVEEWGTNTLLLRYATPGWLRESPSLWITFDQNRARVVHVSVYPVIADERAVYEAAAHHPLFEAAEFDAMFE